MQRKKDHRETGKNGRQKERWRGQMVPPTETFIKLDKNIKNK